MTYTEMVRRQPGLLHIHDPLYDPVSCTMTYTEKVRRQPGLLHKSRKHIEH